MIIDTAAVLLFLLPVPGWVATVLLLVASFQDPKITALTERAQMAVVLSFAATGVALLAASRLSARGIPNELAIAILIGVFFAVSAPQLVWLFRFLRGDFGRKDVEP